MRQWLVFSLQATAIYLQVFAPWPSMGQEPIKKLSATEDRILQTLETQTAAWNSGDILGFMQTYWKSDKLTFSSGGETQRGWQATLERYQKSYPREKMGRLHFDNQSIEMLGENAALVLGNWHLDLNGQKKDGNFSLVLRKLDDDWLIIHDHSSIYKPSTEIPGGENNQR